MFNVYHANHLEVHKALLAALIRRAPLSDPFAAEQILVQSPGMAQWLRQALAQEFGVAAQLAFPLPSTFIWQMFSQVLPQVPELNPYTKGAMAWRLMTLLPHQLDDPSFAPLAHYLAEDPDQRKGYQLSQRIADVFDQYLVYRPDWIADWEQGGELGAEAQPWQPKLWRALVTATEQQADHLHRANLFEAFIRRLEQPEPPAGLPQRLFIFGINALPPNYLQALRALGRHMEVHLMQGNPCRFYWGDLLERWRTDGRLFKQLLERRRAHILANLEQEAGHRPLFASQGELEALFNPADELAEGHPLLVSWGKQGRDHQALLADLDPQECEAFADIEPNGLLQRLQADMLDLLDRSRPEAEPFYLLPEDDSLQVRGCHSPMREVEVLHDALLAMLAADATLQPRDILVMVADINAYSPFIQAVFGAAQGSRWLPFAISDRSAQQESPLLQSLLTLLRLPQLRCSAPELLSLLAVPAIQAALGLDEAALAALQAWVQEAGVRWGLDETDGARFELNRMPGNTWQHGLERMLLGFAMAGEDPLADISPYGEVEGQDGVLLGQLALFVERLRRLRDGLPEARNLTAWRELVDDLLLAFYAPDEAGEEELAQVRQALAELARQQAEVGFDAPLSLAVIQDYLTEALAGRRSSGGFLAGRINFCTLMPMRSIPFKVIGLLGMNDGVYPRSVPPLGFDLMAQAPRRGDRSRREDDRYLFLEALLAAEQRLYVSYVDRSSQDNQPREPSVLLAELLDYCQQSCCLPDGSREPKDLWRRLVRQEALVPYDPRYFDPAAPVSYAADWCPPDDLTPAEPFIGQPLPLPGELLADGLLELSDLLRFAQSPVANFFQRSLRVRFDAGVAEPEQDEPFAADALTSYQLRQQLLAASLAGQQASLSQRLRHTGLLPTGALGDLLLDEQANAIQPLLQALEAAHAAPARRLPVDLSLNVRLPDGSERQLSLQGQLPDCHDGVLVRYRAGEFKPVQLVRAWLEHLCLCAVYPPAASLLLGIKGHYRLRPLAADAAQAQLSAWLAAWLQGLTEPLPLLWATCFVSQDPKAQADLFAARERQFVGSDYLRGDSLDPYVARAFPAWNEALHQALDAWDRRLLVPLYDHLEAC